MIRQVTSLVAFALLFGNCSNSFSHAKADDWPQFRGPNRDGKSLSEGIATDWRRATPKLVRELSGAGAGFSSMCVVGTRLYTTGNSEQSQFVVCLDWQSGKEIWKTDLVGVIPNHSEIGSRCTPTYDDGYLYVTSSDGQLFCIAAEQGDIRWRKSFQKDFGGRLMSTWGFSESPLVDGDQVVVTPGGYEALIVALNKSNGELIWKSKVDELIPVKNRLGKTLKEGAGYSSMIKVELGSGIAQYIQLLGRGLVGIESGTGRALWQKSGSANRVSNICSPVFKEFSIVSGSSSRFIYKAVYSTAPKAACPSSLCSPIRLTTRFVPVRRF